MVAAQLALDRPEAVHTLILLEPFMLSVPSGEAVLQQAGPAFEAYGSGDHEGAWAMFLSAASGLDRATCRTVIEKRVPGAVAQAVKDADTLFGVELPAISCTCSVPSPSRRRWPSSRGATRWPVTDRADAAGRAASGWSGSATDTPSAGRRMPAGGKSGVEAPQPRGTRRHCGCHRPQ